MPLEDQLLSLASAIDRLNYAIITDVSKDHIHGWNTIVRYRLEGLALNILYQVEPELDREKRLLQVERFNLPSIYRTTA